MYRADDSSSKSFLVLTLLSYVDAIKPKYCVFENVRGFVEWRLLAVKSGPFSVTGGIPMGGLKLVLRCLTDLKFVYLCPFWRQSTLIIVQISSSLYCASSR
jgi:DNA (cytosine-5)-methyltransferase 1